MEYFYLVVSTINFHYIITQSNALNLKKSFAGVMMVQTTEKIKEKEKK